MGKSRHENNEAHDRKAKELKMVLVIESSTAQRQLVALTLEGSGFTVITAANGLDALKLLETFNVDMVIANLLMPDMMGFEFVINIKNKPDLLSLPIIMMTSIPIRLLNIDKYKGQIDEWIQKPVRPEQIRETIWKYFETPGRKHY